MTALKTAQGPGEPPVRSVRDEFVGFSGPGGTRRAGAHDPGPTGQAFIGELSQRNDEAWRQFLQVYHPWLDGILQRRGARDHTRAEVLGKSIEELLSALRRAQATGGKFLMADGSPIGFRAKLRKIVQGNLLDYRRKKERGREESLDQRRERGFEPEAGPNPDRQAIVLSLLALADYVPSNRLRLWVQYIAGELRCHRRALWMDLRRVVAAHSGIAQYRAWILATLSCKKMDKSAIAARVGKSTRAVYMAVNHGDAWFIKQVRWTLARRTADGDGRLHSDLLSWRVFDTPLPLMECDAKRAGKAGRSRRRGRA